MRPFTVTVVYGLRRRKTVYHVSAPDRRTAVKLVVEFYYIPDDVRAVIVG